MSKHKILLVDDEPFFFELISELLGNDYEFAYAESGLDCVKYAKESKPELILMDVQMPEMDGYDACRTLKMNEDTHEIPVFFVSGNDSLDEKVKGYDAGGEDYIVKPLDGPEIDRKIGLFLSRHQEHQARKTALQTATSAACTALNSQGEQGVIISYLTNSYLCHDLDSVMNQLLVALNDFGYYSVVRLQSKLTSITRNSQLKWNPIEDAIVEQLKSSQRIDENNEWIIFNSEKVHILIRKKPDDDADKLGRVKDHISFLIQGTEARIQNLIVEQDLDEQTTTLFNILKTTHRKLENFSAQKTAARRSISDSIDGFYIEFENNLASIGLTEKQEKDVFDATDRFVNLMIDICADKLNDHAMLINLLNELKRIVEAQS
ncbi:MAG: response regulator [Pseudomonadales bacterium]|nr:response regulator [Pseudomonadales bacterium]